MLLITATQVTLSKLKTSYNGSRYVDHIINKGLVSGIPRTAFFFILSIFRCCIMVLIFCLTVTESRHPRLLQYWPHTSFFLQIIQSTATVLLLVKIINTVFSNIRKIAKALWYWSETKSRWRNSACF